MDRDVSIKFLSCELLKIWFALKPSLMSRLYNFYLSLIRPKIDRCSLIYKVWNKRIL